MDSKSISRKGVGVRLPSLAPEPTRAENLRSEEWERATRDVGDVLWPSLGRELRSARGELEGMLDELRGGHGRLLRDESRLGLQAMTERSRRAGWCLGVLAAAQGIDLLRGRHEPEGLRWIVGDVMEARGLLLTPCAEELPMVVCRACRGWEICLLAALCFLQVGERSDGIVRWSATERDSTTSLSFVGRPPPTSFGAFDASHAGWPRVGMVDGQLVLSWQ